MINSVILRDLISGGWQKLPFEPFRDGITACWLSQGSPGIAVLKYEPGAKVPKHEHIGAEMIVVLEGAQSDESSTYKQGDVIVNPAGSQHEVWSAEGCVVLLNWSKPVRFVD